MGDEHHQNVSQDEYRVKLMQEISMLMSDNCQYCAAYPHITKQTQQEQGNSFFRSYKGVEICGPVGVVGGLGLNYVIISKEGKDHQGPESV